ncbi:GGDEF domain-containing protein [Oxalobacter sp. OttesenSCG-928-P03]|nr:GGDEF domain-containing protein [Oxalobacter sp. OttesenSCG-928-P03]
MSRTPLSHEEHHKLLVRIFEWLSSTDQTKETIGHILTEVCEHYNFGCGFIYEADHAQTFYLKEQYANYRISGLQEPFRLEERLNKATMDILLKNSFFYQTREDHTEEDSFVQALNQTTFILVPVFDTDQTLIGLIGMVDRRSHADISDETLKSSRMVLNLIANHVKTRIIQRNLEFARQSMVSLLDNIGIDIYVNDFFTHEMIYANKTMAAPYGGLENMLGKTCWQALYDDKTGPCDYCPQSKLIDEYGNPSKIYSWDYQRPFDGSWFRVISAAFNWVDGRLVHVISSVDITASKKNEQIIERMALYDALTNLPNRRKLLEDFESSLTEMQKAGKTGYCLFFDLDDFKQLNDVYGHQVGDEFLMQISDTLLENPLTRNNTYRYGGDEFILLYKDIGKEHINSVIYFLLERFSRPWQLKNLDYTSSASIGVTAFPDGNATIDSILNSADQMMYQAKENGKGRACFSNGEFIVYTPEKKQ